MNIQYYVNLSNTVNYDLLAFQKWTLYVRRKNCGQCDGMRSNSISQKAEFGRNLAHKFRILSMNCLMTSFDYGDGLVIDISIDASGPYLSLCITSGLTSSLPFYFTDLDTNSIVNRAKNGMVLERPFSWINLGLN